MKRWYLTILLLLLMGVFGVGLAADAEEYAGQLYPAREGERWGYIREDGTWAIEPDRFTRAFPFLDCGLAPVELDVTNDSGPFRLIDRSGAIAVTLSEWRLETNDDLIPFSVQESLERVRVGNALLLRCINYEATPRYALYLADQGELLELSREFFGYELAPQTESLSVYASSYQSAEPHDVSIRAQGDQILVSYLYNDFYIANGRIQSTYERHTAVLDASGQLVANDLETSEHPDTTQAAEEGSAPGTAWKKAEDWRGAYYLADADGKRLTQDLYFYLDEETPLFEREWEPVRSLSSYSVDFVHADGTMLFGWFPFTHADAFQDGLAQVQLWANDYMPLQAYIRENGEVVWAERGQKEDVQRWLTERTSYTAATMTVAEAASALVGEWDCTGGGEMIGYPILFYADGTCDIGVGETMRYRVLENTTDAFWDEAPFVLVFGDEDGFEEAEEGFGLTFSDRNTFSLTFGEGGGGYARVPTGYWAAEEAADGGWETEKEPLASLPDFDGKEEKDWPDLGVFAFRASAHRANAASGQADRVDGLSLLWETKIGPASAREEAAWQPLIIKWPLEFRQASANLYPDKRDKVALKEVIAAGTDGKLYFLDLADGTPTRDAFDGSAWGISGTPSLHNKSYPFLAVPTRSGIRLLNMLTGDEIAVDEDQQGHGQIDSVLVQDQYILFSDTWGMGLLLAEPGLSLPLSGGSPDVGFRLAVLDWTEYPCGRIYAPLCADGSYAWYTKHRSVYVTDLATWESPASCWLGGTALAAPAAERNDDGRTDLYIGDTMLGRSGQACQIARLDGQSLEPVWTRTFLLQQDTALINGVVASPVLGEGTLKNLCFFTVTGRRSASGLFSSFRSEEGAVLAALDKATGDTVWSFPLDERTVSSPVAVYAENGKGYIIQASGSGTLFLLDGQTGNQLATLSLNGSVSTAPAVYRDRLVIRRTGEDGEYLCAVSLAAEETE